MNKTFLISGVIALALGSILTLVGAFMKLEHCAGAKDMLILSLVATTIGIGILAIGIIKRQLQKTSV
jgi:hypothetical protein